MKLIVDSGSTKTDWIAIDDSGNILFETQTLGLNPQVLSEAIVEERIINNYDLYRIRNEVDSTFFYGAGCSTKQKNKIIEIPFKEYFYKADININHDLDAACYAMYNNKPNITCILGTGSNSCMFDGKNIIENAPSLGFIMGDEASGNYFGKKLSLIHI